MVAAVDTNGPPRQLQPGNRFGRKYALVRRIAVGGMGEIWVAKNEMTSAEVALKVLRADLDTKMEEVVSRFKHEAQLGAMLGHRNIVKVFDLLEEPDGTLVLVMELLRGLTLRRTLKDRVTVSTEQAVALVVQVLSALQHAHEMGIVHRDLKPANILLAVDPDGHVTPKLLDFGIAKVPAAGQRTMFGKVLGTPRYMSPEQIRSDPKIDGRSDVFSAATLLYEMLTGVCPFQASSPSASLAAVLETKVDPDERIAPAVWLVIQRALAKRPYERFASAGEFATALRKAVSATDADLNAALQELKPALERQPSLTGELHQTGSSDHQAPPAHVDPEEEEEAAAAASERAILEPGPHVGEVIANSSRPPAAMPVPLIPVGDQDGGEGHGNTSLLAHVVGIRRRRQTYAAAGAAAVVVLAIGFFALRPKPPKASTASINEAPTAAALPPNIPPPPDDVTFEPASSAAAASNSPKSDVKHASSTSGGNKSTPPAPTPTPPKKGPDKKKVASKPDF